MNTADQNFRLLQEIEANRRFLLMAYEQNPALLASAEPRIRQLFESASTVVKESACSPSAGKQCGVSLIELIMFIVIVSVALTGILAVMNVTTRGSADPLVRKQALAVAESLLEEVELQDFNSASGVTNAVTQANRSTEYHIVNDYNGFNMPAPPGIYALNDSVTPIAGLTGYSASVTVGAPVTIGAPAAIAVLITVTVTDPQTNQIQISGYRTQY